MITSLNGTFIIIRWGILLGSKMSNNECGREQLINSYGVYSTAMGFGGDQAILSSSVNA